MTTPINDGGQAFPRPSGPAQEGIDTIAKPGMSLRAWFAGKAMNGILSQSPAGFFSVKRSIWEACWNQSKADNDGKSDTEGFAEIVAATSVLIADKLIAELEKGTK